MQIHQNARRQAAQRRRSTDDENALAARTLRWRRRRRRWRRQWRRRWRRLRRRLLRVGCQSTVRSLERLRAAAATRSSLQTGDRAAHTLGCRCCVGMCKRAAATAVWTGDRSSSAFVASSRRPSARPLAQRARFCLASCVLTLRLRRPPLVCAAMTTAAAAVAAAAAVSGARPLYCARARAHTRRHSSRRLSPPLHLGAPICRRSSHASRVHWLISCAARRSPQRLESAGFR